MTNISTTTTADGFKLLRVREFCFTKKFCVKAKLLGTSAHLKIIQSSTTAVLLLTLRIKFQEQIYDITGRITID